MSGLIIGYSLDFLNITPIIKKIATSSFVFASGGWAILALAFCYWLIDVKKIFTKGIQIFHNCRYELHFHLSLLLSRRSRIVRRFFTPFATSLLLMGRRNNRCNNCKHLLTWAAQWYICYWLFKNKLFIKI